MRGALRAVFEEEFEVIAAPSAAGITDSVLDEADPVDLVVIGFTVATEDALEIVDRARAAARDVGIVFLIDDAEGVQSGARLDAQRTRYLQMPVECAELLDVAAQLLTARSH